MTHRKRTVSRRRGRLILVIGGSASGKSVKALELAGRVSPRVFVATGRPLDSEMAERIRRHQASRGTGWKTEEVPIDLVEWFDENRGQYRTVVLDCITLWLSNLRGKGVPKHEIPGLVTALLHAMRGMKSRVVIVTNELGMGLVPFDPDTRRFRDLAGKANQQLAQEADEVHLVVTGLSVRLK